MVVHQLPHNLVTCLEMAERAADCRLTILGWHYSIDKGVGEHYDREQLPFALDLSRVSALDDTGLSMAAEVMDRHPHLDVWVAFAEKTPAFQGAGVPEDRIHIQENGLVRLRDVLATIQADDPTELAAVSAKAQ